MNLLWPGLLVFALAGVGVLLLRWDRARKRRPRPRYTAAELMAQCDPNAPMPADMIAWDRMPDVGLERQGASQEPAYARDDGPLSKDDLDHIRDVAQPMLPRERVQRTREESGHGSRER